MSWAIRCHSTNDAHPTRKIRTAQRTCRDFDKDLVLRGDGNWDVKDFKRLLKLDVTGKFPGKNIKSILGLYRAVYLHYSGCSHGRKLVLNNTHSDSCVIEARIRQQTHYEMRVHIYIYTRL